MTAQPDPAHGCTINGQPAIPIPVAEYNQLTADLAALRADIEGCRAQQWPQRLGRAEKTIARVQALADEYPAGIDTALIHEALDTQEQT